MALISCPECGYKHSEHAGSCPKCGLPRTKKSVVRPWFNDPEEALWIRIMLPLSILLFFGTLFWFGWMFYQDFEGEEAENYGWSDYLNDAYGDE